MPFSDSHCHLDRVQPELLVKILEQAREKGVDTFVSVAMNLESSEETIRLAQSHPGVFAAIGIHPWNAVPVTEDVRRQFSELAKREGVVAIGETGLDYARSPETKEVQKELFIYELSLARETGLPVNIHCREAHQDMMDILRKEMSSNVIGIIHGFSGNSAALKDWLSLGLYISIGKRGFTTGDNPTLEAAVRDIPLDRLLTETDLTGAEQPPSLVDVVAVAEKLASIRGVTTEEVANAATENLKRLIKIL